MKFEIDSQSRPPTLHLEGDLDETSDFTSAPLPASGALAIDLVGITHINSMGLRGWVEWTAKIKHLSPIFMRHCTPLLINQINILDSFMPRGAIVESFFVPYYCEPCEKSFTFLALRGRDFREATSDQPEQLSIENARPCPNCGKAAEADIIEGIYYKFLKLKR